MTKIKLPVTKPFLPNLFDKTPETKPPATKLRLNKNLMTKPRCDKHYSCRKNLYDKPLVIKLFAIKPCLDKSNLR